MNKHKVSSPREALALSNVINPGGQRIDVDGSIKPGLDQHETNCAFVALATAAFIQDGTEVSAPSAPSALLINGNDFLVQYAATLSTEYSDKIRITIVDIGDRLRFHDDTSFRSTYKPEDVINKVREALRTHEGRSILAHGQTEDSHHWFNITPYGNVVDIQIGEIGEHLLIGQLYHDGVRRYEQLEFIVVPEDMIGIDIIQGTEAMHQFNGMVDLARYIQKNLDPDQQIDLNQLIEHVSDGYVDQLIAQGVKESATLHNQQTHVWFNKFCEQIEAISGKDKLMEVLNRAMSDLPEGEISEGRGRTWMSEATFRKPGTTEVRPSLVETFAERCPILNDSLELSKFQIRPGGTERPMTLDL